MLRLLSLPLGFAVLALGGCGSTDEKPTPNLKVSAASSLKRAFTSYGQKFTPADVQHQFAASDELAAQIRGGAHPDVYAAANAKLPAQLFAEGLVEKPVAFATNRLVIAVPADSKLTSIDDVVRAHTTIAVGQPGVPVGDYTTKVLDALPAATRTAVTRNIRSKEPDVSTVAARVRAGAVDAGFVYVTDVEASDGALKAIGLPAGVSPPVVYGVAVVKGSDRTPEARTYIAGLLSGEGAAALRAAGFGPAP